MKFTKKQIEELVWESDVETFHGENRRWSRSNSTVVEYEGKFYELYWEEGLTEGQENEFEAQDAPEVKQVTETLAVTKWVDINSKESETIDIDLSFEDYFTLNEKAREQNLILDDFINKILAKYIEKNTEKLSDSN